MKDLLNYLTIEKVVLFVVVLAILVGAGYLINKIVSSKKEKERKEHPSVLTIEHADRLFKIMKLDKEKNIAFLSLNPNRNYPSGKGGGWFSSANIPKELVIEGQVLDVMKVSDKEIKIVEHSSF